MPCTGRRQREDRVHRETIFVTGGAGFIGSALIRYLLSSSTADVRVVNVDKLTYAGRPALRSPSSKRAKSAGFL